MQLAEDKGGRGGTVSAPRPREGSAIVEGSLKSEVAWLARDPETKWIFDRIDAVVREVNEEGKFDLSEYNVIQIARYFEGNYCAWHLDIGKQVSSLRKLSIIVQLSEPADYDGGVLEPFSF